ncbi:MAG: calcium/sodium antiporter [Gammaproteobacteria bacterium]
MWGADRFVAGSVAIARNFQIPPLLIGLTIVAMGTSAPEVVVSVTASLKGNAGLAIGNAVGSNIANIGVVLALTAIIKPLKIDSAILKREYPILFAVTALSLLLLIDYYFSRWDGVILLIGAAIFIGWSIYVGLHADQTDALQVEFTQEMQLTLSTTRASIYLVIGMICLPLGAEFLVRGAVTIARYFEVSDVIIGLTVVAIGTSLPELATSIVAAFKNEQDIVLGNVMGSNIFNLLMVLPMAALFAPGEIVRAIIWRDALMMVILTAALFIVAYGFRRGPGHITRFEGLLLFASYIAYLSFLQ